MIYSRNNDVESTADLSTVCMFLLSSVSREGNLLQNVNIRRYSMEPAQSMIP